MLITNFSSGELSNTLFGRTDLPQYYSGASLIENFDIIPTGGIERRSGTKRIPVVFKDEKGEAIIPIRIIPFVLSRDEAYLVIFINEKIIIYRVGEWNKPKIIFTNKDFNTEDDILEETLKNKLYSDDEIPLIQHAQNFRMMVLAHKNHPPIQIDFESWGIRINFFYIRTLEKFIHSEDFVPTDIEKNDEVYSKNGYLKKSGQYPGCVTFFNGRIVFASTNERGQRLFFSKVNDINNFCTYKTFITEKREYKVIYGKLLNNAERIQLANKEEAEKITSVPWNYTIDSIYFKPGIRFSTLPYEGTKVENGKTVGTGIWYIDMDGKAENIISKMDDVDIQRIKERLDLLSSEYTSKNNAMATEVKFFAEFPKGSGVFKFHINIGVFKAVLSEDYSDTKRIIELPNDFAKYFDEGNIDSKLYSFIHDSCTALVGQQPSNYGREYERVIDAWKPLIEKYMRFSDPKLENGKIYYDYIPNIKSLVNFKMEGMGSDVFIPIYTSEQIRDDYPTPEDGFTFEVASDRNDDIRWLVQNKNLIVGTESAEYIIPSNITAVNVSAYLNSFYGSSKIQATSAGDAVLFFRDGQKGLVEYHIPEADNYFRTNDLLALAPQMLRENKNCEAVDFDVVTMPYTKLIITRADGKMVTLLYDRSSGVFAWNRISLGSGNAKSLAVIPGKSGYDDIYLIVEKDGTYHLELFESESNVYLDSFKQWDGDRSGYSDEAVIFEMNEQDERKYKVYKLTEPLPDASDKCFIGYPYTSRIRSMPVLSNNKMKPTVIKNILIRFLDSYTPKLKSLPNGVTDTITCEEPYSGVWKCMFPGSWERDVFFELIHEKPTRCKILAVNAEVN